jgi:glycerophosphoryl diester phosphodiesterase
MPMPPLLLGSCHPAAAASAENIRTSLEDVLQHGCDGFGFDVRRSGCGSAVVCHEAEVAGASLPQAAENQSPCTLLSLQDVLRRYAARCFLNIELKAPGLESAVLVALAACPPEKGYVVSSLLPEVLEDLRLRSETVPLGLVCSQSPHLARWRDLPAQYVILHQSCATRELIDEVADANLKSLVAEVNDRNSLLRFADWDVDGILSDNTRLMAQSLRGSGAGPL